MIWNAAFVEGSSDVYTNLVMEFRRLLENVSVKAVRAEAFVKVGFSYGFRNVAYREYRALRIA